MAKYAVHRCHLYHPSTSAINVLSYENELEKLAVAKADGALEVYDTRSFIVRETSHLKVSASSVWCLTKSPTETHIATGTEDGGVVLLHVDGDEGNKITIVKTLVRIEKRILCLTWHDDGLIIAGGSVDAIRLWNVENGRCLLRISVPRQQLSAEVIVWSIVFGKDMLLVSGDSEGRTSFWNGRNGTLINSFESHKADVLVVVADKTNNCFYSTGIEPVICQFVAVEEKLQKSRDYGEIRPIKRQKSDVDVRLSFVEGTRRNIHTNDVRTAALFRDFWLISGGIDTFIGISKYPPNNVQRIPPFDSNRIQFAQTARRVLFQHEKFVEIWSLGSTNELPSDKNGEILKLDKKPLKIAEIKTKEKEWIVCSALNAAANYAAYSNDKRTTVFHIMTDEANNSAEIKSVKCLNGSLPAASYLLFSPVGDSLIVATNDSFCVVAITEDFCKIETEIKFPNEYSVRKMAASSLSSFLAAVTTNDDVIVTNLKNKSIVSTLPRYNASPIDVHFTSSTEENLIVLYSDGALLEYSTKFSKYTEWCRNFSDQFASSIKWTSPPVGLTLPTANSSEIFVYSSTQLILVKKCQKAEKSTDEKLWFKENTNFKWLCKFSSLTNGEVVAVEIENENYAKRLPPALHVRKFGTG